MSPWLFKFKGWLGEGVDAEQSSKKSVNVRSTGKRLASDQSRFPHPLVMTQNFYSCARLRRQVSRTNMPFVDWGDETLRGCACRLRDGAGATQWLVRCLMVPCPCLIRCLALVWSVTCVLNEVEEGDLVGES